VRLEAKGRLSGLLWLCGALWPIYSWDLIFPAVDRFYSSPCLNNTNLLPQPFANRLLNLPICFMLRRNTFMLTSVIESW
jgi:hypothetical protein